MRHRRPHTPPCWRFFVPCGIRAGSIGRPALRRILSRRVAPVACREGLKALQCLPLEHVCPLAFPLCRAEGRGQLRSEVVDFALQLRDEARRRGIGRRVVPCWDPVGILSGVAWDHHAPGTALFPGLEGAPADPCPYRVMGNPKPAGRLRNVNGCPVWHRASYPFLRSIPPGYGRHCTPALSCRDMSPVVLEVLRGPDASCLVSPFPRGVGVGPEAGRIGRRMVSRSARHRARAYIAWIREHAPPHLKEARQMIRTRYPGVSTDQSLIDGRLIVRPRLEYARLHVHIHSRRPYLDRSFHVYGHVDTTPRKVHTLVGDSVTYRSPGPITCSRTRRDKGARNLDWRN